MLEKIGNTTKVRENKLAFCWLVGKWNGYKNSIKWY